MFKNKIKFLWIILILIISGAVYYYFINKNATGKFTTFPVTAGDLTQTVYASADVVSEGQIDLSFKTAGVVKLMNVAVGDKVTKGQMIAELDKGTLAQQVAQGEANVNYQQQILNNMQLSRNDTVFTSKQRAAQKANVAAAEAAVAATEQQLSETILYAPMNGIVAKKNFDQNENVAANQPVVSLAGAGDLEVKAKVPEAGVDKISLGQKAYAQFDAIPNEKIPLTVTDIEPDVTVVQGNNYYIVTLQLPSQNSRIKNGMSPDVYIVVATAQDALSVPVSALRQDSQGTYVKILNADRTTTRNSTVETGIQDDNGNIEIKSGLTAGDVVVL